MLSGVPSCGSGTGLRGLCAGDRGASKAERSRLHVVEVFAVVLDFAGGYVKREDEGPEGRRVARRGLVEIGCVCVCVLRLLKVGGVFRCEVLV